jgi:hypothetical protein
MNSMPIEQAKSLALRHSRVALARAAERAREIAIQKNTLLVVSRDGKVVDLDPRTMRPVKPKSSK